MGVHRPQMALALVYGLTRSKGPKALAMETFFRKYFWTAHLVFILLVALIATKTINLFLESVILPTPKEDAARSVAPARAAEAVSHLDLERIAKLTGLPLRKEPEVQDSYQSQLDTNAPAVK